ncbi:unnamed protein product [Tenebrio molitor]|nr:unnamed protein product [Tenebrio molitor]
MVCTCCVPKCTNTTQKGFKLFRVPTGATNLLKRQKWLSLLGRSKSFVKGMRVCCV